VKQLSQHRQRMEDLEHVIKQFDQVELETEHFFAHGTYTRVLHLPKDTILTGKIHRHSCINVISKGRILVATDDGDFEIVAPHVFVSGSGVKKAGYTLEDTIWINVHPWEDEEDLDLIEKMVIAPNYEALENQEDLI